ncbi:hypothetical protein VE03_02238 [Pseudogymnoascus sp. 23342-1-I1]|nr:hypothetical protein VE03_02238 [Pseudogymnoascus sp. 23342-1-I1]
MEPPHILNLPDDILYEIFNHFKCDKIHRGLFDSSIYDDGAKRLTVQDARLVCRLFNKLASPLLCPTLRVRLDHASLDLVAKVSESPLIAEGVCNIEIVVGYRPRELATDLLRFAKHRAMDLRFHIGDGYRCVMEEIEFNGGDDETISDYPYEVYQQITDYGENIRSAWIEYTRAADKGAISPEYLHLLLQGHQEYIQKHEEQFQLITDGSFVERLASAMSRMAHCASLHFVDDVDCYSTLDDVSPLVFRDDAREFSRFMTAPLSWSEIRHLKVGEILPAKLLWELPIALHKAGLILRAMLIHTFPHPDWCPAIYPATWTNLYDACHHLRIFRLEGISLGRSSETSDPVLGRGLAFVERYIGTVLSSEDFELINLRFRDSAVGDDVASYRVGLLPEAINWPRIKKLSISYISLSQDELEKFCCGLGYMVEDIRLNNIDLRSGSWAGALDMLRERVPKKRQEMILPCFCFWELTGGEFGKESRESYLGIKLTKNPLVEKCRDYVFGLGVTENPLR